MAYIFRIIKTIVCYFIKMNKGEKMENSIEYILMGIFNIYIVFNIFSAIKFGKIYTFKRIYTKEDNPNGFKVGLIAFLITGIIFVPYTSINIYRYLTSLF